MEWGWGGACTTGLAYGREGVGSGGLLHRGGDAAEFEECVAGVVRGGRRGLAGGERDLQVSERWLRICGQQSNGPQRCPCPKPQNL